MRSVILLHDMVHSGALHTSLCNTGYTVLAELDAPHTLHHDVQRLVKVGNAAAASSHPGLCVAPAAAFA